MADSAHKRREQIERQRARQQREWMEQRQLAMDRETVENEHATSHAAVATARQPLDQQKQQYVDGSGLSTDRKDRRDQSAVLDRLTERISVRLRAEIEQELRQEGVSRHTQQDAEAGVERLLAGELGSQTCAICMELMLAPARPPVMLFPCGHTFCKPWCVPSVRNASN